MRRSRPTACERQSRQGKKSGLKSSRHPQKVLKRPGQQAAERGPRAAEQHHGPPAAARFGQRAGHCVELAGHALDNGRQALDLLGLRFDLGLQHCDGDVRLAELFLVEIAHSLAAPPSRVVVMITFMVCSCVACLPCDGGYVNSYTKITPSEPFPPPRATSLGPLN